MLAAVEGAVGGGGLFISARGKLCFIAVRLQPGAASLSLSEPRASASQGRGAGWGALIPGLLPSPGAAGGGCGTPLSTVVHLRRTRARVTPGTSFPQLVAGEAAGVGAPGQGAGAAPPSLPLSLLILLWLG